MNKSSQTINIFVTQGKLIIIFEWHSVVRPRGRAPPQPPNQTVAVATSNKGLNRWMDKYPKCFFPQNFLFNNKVIWTFPRTRRPSLPDSVFWCKNTLSLAPTFGVAFLFTFLIQNLIKKYFRCTRRMVALPNVPALKLNCLKTALPDLIPIHLSTSSGFWKFSCGIPHWTLHFTFYQLLYFGPKLFCGLSKFQFTSGAPFTSDSSRSPIRKGVFFWWKRTKIEG